MYFTISFYCLTVNEFLYFLKVMPVVKIYPVSCIILENWTCIFETKQERNFQIPSFCADSCVSTLQMDIKSWVLYCTTFEGMTFYKFSMWNFNMLFVAFLRTKLASDQLIFSVKAFCFLLFLSLVICETYLFTSLLKYD